MALLTSTGKRLRDFSIQVPVLDQSNNLVGLHNKVTLVPRYTDASTAHTKTFTTAGDYSDSSYHNASGSGWSYDFKIDWPINSGAGYNYTYDTYDGRRGSANSPTGATALNDYGTYISLYLDLAIGQAPHPGVGVSYAHMAMLVNAHGAYNPYNLGGPAPDYTSPNTFPSVGVHNVKVSGQNYNAHLYRQWFCWCDTISSARSNSDILRIINWGGSSAAYSQVQVAGIGLILHGMGGANSGAGN